MLKFIIGGGNNQKKTDVGGEDGDGGGISSEKVMVADLMDLQALPEGCIATVLSLTTPGDACRLSLVSRSFRSASESDAVWNRFLQPEIHTILAHSEQPHNHQPVSPPSSSSSSSSSSSFSYKSKKELYLAVCDNPILIKQGSMSFSLDKWSGKKCYMISARSLSIIWGDTPHYWKWITVPNSRFEEVAELVSVCWLEIRGKFDTRLLSPSTIYKAHLVFKSTAGAYGFEQQPIEVTVGFAGGGEPTKQTVFLDADRGQNVGHSIGPGPRLIGIFNRRHIFGFQAKQPREIDEAQYPKEREDGWLEIELGEFFCDGRYGDLEMACLEVRGGQWKGGLIIQGIEIRPKRF